MKGTPLGSTAWRGTYASNQVPGSPAGGSAHTNNDSVAPQGTPSSVQLLEMSSRSSSYNNSAPNSPTQTPTQVFTWILSHQLDSATCRLNPPGLTNSTSDLVVEFTQLDRRLAGRVHITRQPSRGSVAGEFAGPLHGQGWATSRGDPS